jgi:hypothetical protein
MNTAIDVLAMLAGVAGVAYAHLSYRRSKGASAPSARRRPNPLLLVLGLLLLVVAGVASAAILTTWEPRLPLLNSYARTGGLALLGLGVCGIAVARGRDPMERLRARDRALLANHLEGEITLLNNRAQWEDRHYAELQATVETEDRPGLIGFLSRLLWRSQGKRQVRSLTDALAKSSAGLILVEGNPGSGKSVALRHIALEMSRQAKRGRRGKRVLPVYVNLKDLRADAAPDVEMIRAYVLQTLKGANDPEINAFVDAEFAKGLRAGTWLFLFDSFDEIPAILSATEVNETVRSYAEALFQFINGLHRSRGVVASREFRGPPMAFGAKFRIRDLAEQQKREFVHLVLGNDHPGAERTLIGELPTAHPDVQKLSGNPLFLRLLCDHMAEGHPFPTDSHSVFETYVDTRLNKQDRTRTDRLRLPLPQVREIAEQLAYCMTAERLSLAPQRVELCRAMEKHRFPSGPEVFEVMDLLQAMRLAHTADPHEPASSPSFQFVHRRFQEYFATCVVLREPKRVKEKQLLTDGAWRETAVAILQTQPPQKTVRLLKEADRLLEQALATAPEVVADPSTILADSDPGHAGEAGPFPWPSPAEHILSLLDAGFAARQGNLTASIRQKADRLLTSAASRGQIYDRKWALDVAGTASREVLLWLIRQAVRSPFSWLREAGYRQIGRLGRIPDDISLGIRQMLLTMAARGDLRRQRLAVEVQLRGLEQPEEFLSLQRLLLAAPLVDLGLHLILVLGVLPFWPIRGGLALTVLAAFSTRLTHLLPGVPVHAWRSPASLPRELIDRYGPDAVLSGASRVLLLIVPLFLGLPLRELVLWLLGILYVATWSIGAIWAAALGRPTGVAKWPLIHIKLAGELLRARAKQGRLKRDILGVLSIAAFYGALIWTPILYDSYRERLPEGIRRVISLLSTPLTWIFGLAFGIILLVWIVWLLIGGVKYLRHVAIRVSDWLWTRNWLRACASRWSWAAAWAAVPAVVGPGAADQAATDDGGAGQR